MRKSAIFWLGMAAVCGTVLFHTSQKASDTRQDLRRMEATLLREEESIRVLRAEWSYLNQPERLEKLARQYLDLTPLHGRQFARVTDLNERIDEKLIAATTAATLEKTVEPAAGAPVKVAPAKTTPVVKTPPAKRPSDAAYVPPPRPRPPAATTAPIAQPVVQMAPQPSGTRAFTDVMKSLGVD